MTDFTIVTESLQPRKYKDLNLLFSINAFTRDISKKENEEAIKFAITNLLRTRKYERPFHPEISSDIESVLFENYTAFTKTILQRSVEDVIRAFEPRARLISVDIDPAEIDRNEITMTIVFALKNTTQPIKFTVKIKRAR